MTDEELMDLAGTEKVDLRRARFLAPLPPCGPMSPAASALVKARMRAYERAHPGTYRGPYRQFLLGNAYGKLVETAEVVDSAKKGDQLASLILKATGQTPGTDDDSGAWPAVANMQKMLAGIGMAVRPTGRVDAATVDAINAVFAGWDDAPPKLRGGKLTQQQIERNLPAVSKYLHAAIHGAQDFGDATRGW